MSRSFFTNSLLGDEEFLNGVYRAKILGVKQVIYCFIGELYKEYIQNWSMTG